MVRIPLSNCAGDSHHVPALWRLLMPVTKTVVLFPQIPSDSHYRNSLPLFFIIPTPKVVLAGGAWQLDPLGLHMAIAVE